MSRKDSGALFSPLTILIGVLATVVPDVVVFVTVLKIGLIVLGGIGTYLVARDYGAREPFAIVAGLVVGLSGHSVFIDWPSWVNGQMGAALLPWAWWFTRRAMAGRSPVGALILCYLVISVGYVYCAMWLAVILLGCLVDAALSRSRRELLTVLGLCDFSGLVSIAVYLPGVLTSPVTMRDSWAIVCRGRFTVGLQDFFSRCCRRRGELSVAGSFPSSCGWISDGSVARPATWPARSWRRCYSPVGPRSERHGAVAVPQRVVPALMVPLVVLLAVVASRCSPDAGPPFRLLLSLAWVGGAAYVVVARDPDQGAGGRRRGPAGHGAGDDGVVAPPSRHPDDHGRWSWSGPSRSWPPVRRSPPALSRPAHAGGTVAVRRPDHVGEGRRHGARGCRWPDPREPRHCGRPAHRGVVVPDPKDVQNGYRRSASAVSGTGSAACSTAARAPRALGAVMSRSQPPGGRGPTCSR